MRAHVDNLAVFVLLGVREDQVSQEGIILSPGPPTVCFARRDELLNAYQPVAGRPPLGRAEVRSPRADQPAGGPLWERPDLAVAQ
ncbi:MAG: hypothetical protein ACRDN0_09025 [Trebonia sp.]